jgi:hypothetical protein
MKKAVSSASTAGKCPPKLRLFSQSSQFNRKDCTDEVPRQVVTALANSTDCLSRLTTETLSLQR